MCGQGRAHDTLHEEVIRDGPEGNADQAYDGGVRKEHGGVWKWSSSQEDGECRDVGVALFNQSAEEQKHGHAAERGDQADRTGGGDPVRRKPAFFGIEGHV